MSTYSPVPFSLESLPRFNAAARAAGAAMRSKGTHLSDIIKYIMVRGWGKKYDTSPGPISADRAVKMDLGFLWEDIFTQGLREYFVAAAPETWLRGIEITHEGIAMTPDLIVADGDPPRVEEFKWTKRSLGKFKRDPDSEFHDWLLQTVGYCVGVSASLGVQVRTARLVPCWANGDYTWKPPDGDTCIRPVQRTFEPWEIEQYWQEITLNKQAMEREIQAGTWSVGR